VGLVGSRCSIIPDGIPLGSNWYQTGIPGETGWILPHCFTWVSSLPKLAAKQLVAVNEKEVVHISGPKMISSPMKGKLQKLEAIIRDPTAFVSVALTEI